MKGFLAFQRHMLLAGAAVFAASVSLPQIASAETYQIGDVDVSTTTSFSLGTTMRVSDQDCHYISEYNGGCANKYGIYTPVSNDDGNVNAESGDLTSLVAKVTAEADISYQNYGAFIRATAFYDYWADEKVGEDTTKFGRRPLQDALRSDDAHDAASRGFDLLDAFVYANLDVADMPLSLRVGNQVVNWGESLFIPGGINAYLPIDVGALVTPGSEVKEALKPQPSIYASLGLPYNTSIEGYYTFGFEKSDLVACGTFFSGHDGFCDGGAYVTLSGEYPNAPAVVPRLADDDARDQGQFGVAIRHYAEDLNGGTELAFYYNRFHSKLPFATFTASTPFDVGGLTGIPALVGTTATSARSFCEAVLGTGVSFNTCNSTIVGGASVFNLAVVGSARTKFTKAVYPEDIESFGFSFNTLIDLLGGTALAGEMAYSPNMPFQLADTEINANDLEKNSVDDFAFGLPDGTLADNTITRSGATIYAAGETIRGYERIEAWTGQFQTTSTLPMSHPIVAAMDADLLILLSNVGFQYLPTLGSDNRIAATRSGTGHSNSLADAILGQGQGFVQWASDFSWGYRLAAVAEYNNFMGSVWTLSPYVQFRHDVNGHSAGPIGPGFIEKKKAVSIGVNGTYEDRWKVGLGYTNNFGAEDIDYAADKDFVSLTASYTF